MCDRREYLGAWRTISQAVLDLAPSGAWYGQPRGGVTLEPWQTRLIHDCTGDMKVTVALTVVASATESVFGFDS